MVIEKVITFLIIIYAVAADTSSQCPNIIKRSEWGAKAARSTNYLIVPIPYVVIHHTVTASCTQRSQCAQTVANIQSMHMDTNGWHDIGYSFLIGGDGNVYEGVGWIREGAHTLGYNKKSVGIAFIGSYEDNDASQAMLDAAHKLIACGKDQRILRSTVRVIGARQAGATASPGFALFSQIQGWPEWVSVPKNKSCKIQERFIVKQVACLTFALVFFQLYATIYATALQDAPSQCIDAMASWQWGALQPSFLIGGDSVPYEGRGWTAVGGHTRGWNDQFIGIGFIGDFSNGSVSDAMLANTHQLIQYGKAIGILARNVSVVGARHVRANSNLARMGGLAVIHEARNSESLDIR